jgi:hypothetical protein
MKHYFAQMGLWSFLLILGLLTGCASLGQSPADGPEGTYTSFNRGEIVFDSISGTWEAGEIGYRGSYAYNASSTDIVLTAAQQFIGYRWVDISPIRNFSEGKVTWNSVTLGDSTFYCKVEEEVVEPSEA